jgi:hypothetical protein
MLVQAVTFLLVVKAVHIAFAVIAFGVTFAYPLIGPWVARNEQRSVPFVHRMQAYIGKRLITGGMLILLIAGIYLASKEHQWKEFYVQWGLGVVIVLGALGGLFFGPNEERAAELAERDVAASSGGEVQFSAEYQAVSKRIAIVGTIANVLILASVYIMVVGRGY